MVTIFTNAKDKSWGWGGEDARPCCEAGIDEPKSIIA